MDEHRISLCGLQTRYLSASSGRPIVLLHALGEDSSQLSAVIRALAPRYRLFALDLPGLVGRVRPPRYTSEWFASFLAAFIEDVTSEEVAVVGNSFGGLVALKLALSQRERVAALGLVASIGLGVEVSPLLQLPTLPGLGEIGVLWTNNPLGRAHLLVARAALVFGDPTRVPATWLAQQANLVRRPGFVDGVLAALRAEVDLYGQRDVVVDELPRLDVPTLVARGDRDQVVPIAHGRRAAARLPQASLAVLPGCGHLPPVEQPQNFVAALQDFSRAHSLPDPAALP